MFCCWAPSSEHYLFICTQAITEQLCPWQPWPWLRQPSQQVCRWPPPAGLLSCGVVVFGFAVIRLLCHLELAGREGQLNSAHAKGICIYFNQVLLLFLLPNPLLRDMRSTDKLGLHKKCPAPQKLVRKQSQWLPYRQDQREETAMWFTWWQWYRCYGIPGQGGDDTFAKPKLRWLNTFGLLFYKYYSMSKIEKWGYSAIKYQ